ncbi:threonine--tRNA ligase 1, cytoplasmic-like [Struthio camelus]|uniref:threonine--tRNA ligase 1, cytoplasmic-like n=1 Tax=Struthio camelus TaxID=8801 RepID=UPI003603C89A
MAGAGSQVNAEEGKKADCGKKKMKEGAGDEGRTELNPWPAFINERLEIYNKLKAEHDELLAERAANDSKPIKVTLPDGKQVDAESWKTTPYQIACGISQGLADNTVIAKVNKVVWDLDRPLEEDCTLELLKFEDEEAQAVYWHSSAHIMGEAMERIYGGCLCYGPPIENGFYYDMFLEDGGVSSNDFSALETLCKKIMKEKQAFERLEVKKETLLEMFKVPAGLCRTLILDEFQVINFSLSLMFDHRPRSWRELPLRLADFGVLHRNELSGALTGLTRVRRFQQDDAHIFCAMEQIEEEIKSCLQFLRTVYDVFGFSFKLNLSTRPEKYLGDIEVWNQAEKQLENSLNEFGEKWELNPGDGAFYGPKIDIQIKDAIGRYHQCATIQLDFQLPVRFNLTFVSHDGNDKTRPVIIHRAILGSVERMIAILTENYGGKWPLWLSPQQVMVVPVGPTCDEYAQKVRQQFHDAGLMADVDVDPGCTLNKKIRNAQLAQYNFILVVGEKEKASGTVNIRTRDNKVHGERTIADTVERLLELKRTRCKQAEEEF